MLKKSQKKLPNNSLEDESERFRSMTIAALFYSAVFAFKYMMKNMMQKRVILLKNQGFKGCLEW